MILSHCKARVHFGSPIRSDKRTTSLVSRFHPMYDTISYPVSNPEMNALCLRRVWQCYGHDASYGRAGGCVCSCFTPSSMEGLLFNDTWIRVHTCSSFNVSQQTEAKETRASEVELSIRLWILWENSFHGV